MLNNGNWFPSPRRSTTPSDNRALRSEMEALRRRVTHQQQRQPHQQQQPPPPPPPPPLPLSQDYRLLGSEQQQEEQQRQRPRQRQRRPLSRAADARVLQPRTAIRVNRHGSVMIGGSAAQSQARSRPRPRRVQRQWAATEQTRLASPAQTRLTSPALASPSPAARQPRQNTAVRLSDNELLRRKVLKLRSQLSGASLIAPAPARSASISEQENERLRRELFNLRSRAETPPVMLKAPPTAPPSALVPALVPALPPPSTPPPTRKQQTCVRVIGDWAAENPGDLNLKRGDTLVVIATDPSGWWRGLVTSTGAEGLFPSNHVREVDSVVPPQAAPPAAAPPAVVPPAPQTQSVSTPIPPGKNADLTAKLGELNDVFDQMHASLATMREAPIDGQYHDIHDPLLNSPLQTPWSHSASPAPSQSPPRLLRQPHVHVSRHGSVSVSGVLLDGSGSSPHLATVQQEQQLAVSDESKRSVVASMGHLINKTTQRLTLQSSDAFTERLVSQTLREMQPNNATHKAPSTLWKPPPPQTLLPTTFELSSQEPGSLSDVIATLLTKSLPQRKAFQHATSVNGLTAQMLYDAVSLETDTTTVDGAIAKPRFIKSVMRAVNAYGTPQQPGSFSVLNLTDMLNVVYDSLEERSVGSIVYFNDLFCGLSQFIVDNPYEMCTLVYQTLCSSPSTEATTQHRLARSQFERFAAAVFAVAFSCTGDAQLRLTSEVSRVSQLALVTAACDTLFGNAPPENAYLDALVLNKRSNDLIYDEFERYYMEWHHPLASPEVWVAPELPALATPELDRSEIEAFVIKFGIMKLLKTLRILGEDSKDGVISKRAWTTGLIRSGAIAPNDGESRVYISALYDLIESVAGGAVEVRLAAAALTIFCKSDLESAFDAVFQTHCTASKRLSVRSEPVIQRGSFIHFLRAAFLMAAHWFVGASEFSADAMARALADRFFELGGRGAQTEFVSKSRFRKIFFEGVCKNFS